MPTDADTFRAVVDSTEIWSEVWPQASTERIEGAGHLPLEEAPAAIARTLG